jgi:hypothetical protein
VYISAEDLYGLEKREVRRKFREIRSAGSKVEMGKYRQKDTKDQYGDPTRKFLFAKSVKKAENGFHRENRICVTLPPPPRY